MSFLRGITQAIEWLKNTIAPRETIEETVLPPTLTDQQILDEIRFLREDLATLSPHWNIFFGDKQIARLTERQKALPTYRLERCPKEDWAIWVTDHQEDLLPKLIEWSRGSLA